MRAVSTFAACLFLASAGCRAVDLSPSEEPPPAGSVRVREAPHVEEIDAGDRIDDGGRVLDGGSLDSIVVIDAPADGAAFVRDTVEDGEFVAPVTFEVRSANVAYVELWAADTYYLGDADASGSLTA